MRKAYWALFCGVLLALGTSQVVVTEETTNDVGVATKELREGETYTFQAEVNRLMDILIHSLYSNADIFLRELISNASDALDKIRLLALSDASQLGEGTAASLEVRISVDRDNGILKIRDRGVGMTKEELIKNLGTIAKSGTSSFLEKLQQGGDVNLIGQFGVGFYSVYLVSDYVEVISKANGDKQHIWESKADGSFVITEDDGGAVSGEGDLERGTMLRIHLKEEAQDYMQEHRIKELIMKYSEFIDFPIYLHTETRVPVEEDGDEDDEEETGAKDDDVEEEIEDEYEEEDEDDDAESAPDSPKMPKMQTVMEWKLLNSQKAIWLRNPADVEEEEYNKFFAALSKDDTATPTTHVHFKAEGDVEFRSILFVPTKAPYDYYDSYYSRKPAVKLYVRRVFISDGFDDLLPRYLSFLYGLVDSDTLPINVSRETLQQHRALATIKKKLVRKALDMLKKLAEAERIARSKLAGEESGSEDAEDSAADTAQLEKDVEVYTDFWSEFGKAMKLGIIEDANNRMRLAKLLRFHTSKSTDKLTSLDEYVARMKDGQKNIFYICGQSMDEVQGSPYLERLLEQGYEVIFFTEPMDEYMMQNMADYDDVRFQNASKEDLKLSEDGAEKKAEQRARQTFKPLTQWWRKVLGEDDNLEAVRISNRLSGTPCIVVTSKYGWSANMQRIMQAQALGSADRMAYMQGKRTLEINPRHPLIVELLEKVTADADDKAAEDTARLLYETALLESGFPMQDSKHFAKRVYELMKEQLGVERDLADLHPELVVSEEKLDSASDDDDGRDEL